MDGTLTRRSLLRAFAAGGTLLTGGIALSACQKKSAQGGSKASDVTLKIGGVPTADPYPVMPTAEVTKKDANARGYAAALRGWLEQNPGVKVTHIHADVQDTDALVTSVGGGTAPDLFIGNVLGSWGTGNIRNAFVQGLAADVTDLAEKYGFGGKLNPVVKPAWDFWQIDGKRYGLPYEYSGAGQGLYYRKD
ncbi:MAG TPA: extracellular solute-binding protein, partial [Actinopolymorphaceae bacterium]|nr:extracellular solute-binding protein [Actinopolymorphaceae bacterium]